jgi:predicted TIM-barrel fold metal-dependent hydrolase
VDVGFARVSSGAEGDEALRRRDALDAAERHRVERGVVAGVGASSLSRLDAWRGAAAGRFVPALAVHGSTAPTPADLAAIRQARKDGRVAALEILAQSEGIAPDDPKLEPWWALAEELDLPVSIALGPPSPEAPDPRYRVALGDPLRLEPVLVRHPRLRLDVSRAGWPFGDAMAAIFRAYPQVFVDTGTIAWSLDRREFHAYLRRLVEAGFADRILFASGASQPEPLTHAIEAIGSADFLTAEQKRAILHDNASRWLVTVLR